MKRDPLIEILKSEFARKQARNPGYSLRSFSRDLAIDPSNLSKILSYRKPVGKSLRNRISNHLGITDAVSEPKIGDAAYNPHAINTFEVVAGWEHYAALEILKLKHVKPTARGVAEQLNVSVKRASEILSRLISVGLLAKSGEFYQPVDESSSSILTISTSLAHRKQQKEILEGAIEALDRTPIERRSQSSMTVAIDSAKLEEAREAIRVFRRTLGRLLSNSPNLDQVYQLSISLYPVTEVSNG